MSKLLLPLDTLALANVLYSAYMEVDVECMGFELNHGFTDSLDELMVYILREHYNIILEGRAERVYHGIDYKLLKIIKRAEESISRLMPFKNYIKVFNNVLSVNQILIVKNIGVKITYVSR